MLLALVQQILETTAVAKTLLKQGRTTEAKAVLLETTARIEKLCRDIGTETQSKHLLGLEVQIRDVAKRAAYEENLNEMLALISALERLQEGTVLKILERYARIKPFIQIHGRELDSVGDGQGTGIDPLIKPLVATLVFLGFETDSSCQGHVDFGDPNPWIRFHTTKSIELLVPAVSKYNLQSTVKWEFQKLSTMQPSINIAYEDARELQPTEISRIVGLLEQSIRLHNYEIKIGNQRRPDNNNIFCMSCFMERDAPRHQMKTLFEEIKPLLGKYQVTYSEGIIDPPVLLVASGAPLDQLQADILHISQFLLEHCKLPENQPI